MPRGASRYVGPAFRAHHPKWSYAPTSGEGARLYGGRFNKRGQEALYLSLTYEGAYHEAAGGGTMPSPMTLVSYLLDVEPLLDTFDEEAASLYDLLQDQLGGHYNHQRYHESFKNLTPADVYFGRGQTILLERERIKRNTFEQRRLQHAQSAA